MSIKTNEKMKKRTLNLINIQFTAGLAAVAVGVAASNAAQFGINFEDEWGGDGGAAVTQEALGIPAADWFNMVRVRNSESVAFSTNQTLTVQGAALNVAWGAVNTYSIYADVPTDNGTDQLVYGYLDDSGSGYYVTLSGFRNFASSFKVKTIASSDAANGFTDAVISYGTNTENLAYTSPTPISFGSGMWGESTVSSDIPAISGNNQVRIVGSPKDTTQNFRSTLAGIVITYTPAANNPPLMEVQPAAPTNTVFAGQPFSFKAEASGGQPLYYQWRKDGVAIQGATGASFTKGVAAVGDTGSYDVVVTNAFGTVTSKAVALTISDVAPPIVTKAPLSQRLYAGYPVTFAVEATGGGQLTYQWRKDANSIPGATTASYTISAISATDEGTYTVSLSNPVGTTNLSATLTVKTPTSAFESAMTSRKPALYFRMSETSVPFFDTAGNSGALGASANGAYVGATTRPVPGAIVAGSDPAVSLNGGRVVVPYLVSLNPPAQFTAECWANPVDTTSANRVLIQSMINGENVNNTQDRSGWSLRQNGANLQFLIGGGADSASAFYETTTVSNVITAGVWSHFAAVWSANANSLTLYVNGTAVTNVNPTIPLAPNTAAPILIGDRGYGGWTFKGAIDEVAVYGAALTPAQVLAHYQNGTNTAPAASYSSLVTADGALLYLRLSDPVLAPNAPNGGTLGAAWNGYYTDFGGNPSKPAVTLGEAGPRPPAFVGFESTNTAFSITNGFVMAPRVDLPGGVTAAVWIYREEHESAYDDDLSWLAWLGDGGFHINPDGELRYHWKGGQWGWSSNLRVPVHVWTFAALVVEPDKATIYMSDGTNLLSAVNSVTHAPMVTTSAVGFGGNQPDRLSRHYRGKLDEGAVFDRALSAGEVSYVFNAAIGGQQMVLSLVPGGVLADTKPAGTPHYAFNHGSTWVASSTDAASKTRTGVQQFSAATGSQVVLPADPDFNSTKGTIMFWMRASAPIPGPGSEGAILFDRRALGDAGGGDVIVLNDAGAIFVQTETPPGRTRANTFEVGYLPDDTWHHVTYMYDQSAAGAISLFIDGVLAIASPNTTNWAWPSAQQIEIGRSHDSYWKAFDGFLDDFRIYNRELTAQEIGQVIANGAAVDNNALKVRLDFDNAGIGQSVVWPFGTLESSPVLGPSANWQDVPGATSPYPFLPSTGSLFFRARL